MNKGHVQKILDHGYVKFVDFMGQDEDIIEAARMSLDKGFVSWEPYEDHPDGDMSLLRYLYKKKHATPFEMCQLKIEVMAPIFVFREWHRHRTQSYNEMSARYIPMPDVHYIPSVERIMANADGKNKQAGVAKEAKFPLTEDSARFFREQLRKSYEFAQVVYESGLENSVPKELARLSVPVARYSKMQASANLRNWLAFLTLRMDAAAQWEIRQYANAVGNIIQELYPRTWALFIDGRK